MGARTHGPKKKKDLGGELMGTRTEMFKLLKYAEILGCRVGDLPASYLWMPLCLGSISKSMWNPIVERVNWLL